MSGYLPTHTKLRNIVEGKSTIVEGKSTAYLKSMLIRKATIITKTGGYFLARTLPPYL